jgi:hypothetical protein
MSEAITPPPPEISLSEALTMVAAMSDDYTKSQWFTAFVTAAIVAGDDPEQCVAVVNQLRIVGQLLRAPQLLNQSQQGGFVGVGEISVGQDQLLDRGLIIDADGNPAQVA